MSKIEHEIIDESSIDDIELPPQKVGKRHMYVDNVKLSEEMTIWRDKCDAAKLADKVRPGMSDYIGQCIVLIANNIAKQQQFSRYSWLEEMKSDGIEACCMYLHNFDPRAATRAAKPNAFGYISMIISNAFKHRIQLEKRQDYYKNKSLELMGGAEVFEGEDSSDMGEGAGDMLKDMTNRAYEYEVNQAKKAEIEKAKTTTKKAKPMQAGNLLDGDFWGDKPAAEEGEEV